MEIRPGPVVRTGVKEIDQQIRFKRGRLYVVGAVPAMGKTGFLTFLALAADSAGTRCGFVSTAMSEVELVIRFHAAMGKAREQFPWRNRLDVTPEYQGAQKSTSALSIRSMCTPVPSVDEISEWSRNASIDLLLIDDAHYLADAGGEAAAGLKQLARSSDLPVIATVGLSLENPARFDAWPILPDFPRPWLRNADALLALDRAIYWAREGEQLPGLNVSVLWDRFGVPRHAHLGWLVPEELTRVS